MGKAGELIEIVPLPPQFSVELAHIFADDNLPAHAHIENELPPRRLAGVHELLGESILFLLGKADGYSFGLASCQWHSSFDFVKWVAAMPQGFCPKGWMGGGEIARGQPFTTLALPVTEYLTEFTRM